MANKLSTASELRRVIASIGDQICDTLDNNFDIHVETNTDDIQGQKLAVLVNFLLEKVRRHINKFKTLAAQLEDKVEERTEMLNLVIEGSSDTVWIWHVNANKIEFSSHWYSLVTNDGFSDTLPVEHWFSVVHPSDVENLKYAIQQAKNYQQPLRVEYRLKTYDGCYRWILCRGACQYDSEGTPQIMAGTQTDISALRSRDQSSGLYNRQALIEFIQDEIDASQTVTLYFILVHQYDAISQKVDPQLVIQLRTQVAERLSKIAAQDAMLAKLPGDVFAIAGATKKQNVKQVCEDIRRQFSSPFTVQDNFNYYLNVSIGAVSSSEVTINSHEEIMKCASAALRESRKSNGLCVYDHSIYEKTTRLTLIEHELRKGIREGHVHAYLQPIIHVKTGRISGFEALARFIHPELGFIPPDEFIPIAEQHGLMTELGDCMLEESMKMASKMRSTLMKDDPFYVAINISAKQFEGGDLAEKVMKMLKKYHLPAQYIRLELTESAFMEDMDMTNAQLSNLQSNDVLIALDDFGTGYSSLSYLQSLPIDVLKIDRSFITDLNKKADKAAIVKTIHSLAKLLSLDVVAEGIETEMELCSLQEIGEMHIQGYYFSPPLPWSKIGLFINNHTSNNLQP